MDRNTPAYCRGYLAATYKAYWRCRNIHSCYNIYTAINSFLKTAALLLRKRLSKPILICGSQLLRDQRRFENVVNVSNMIEIIHTYSHQRRWIKSKKTSSNHDSKIVMHSIMHIEYIMLGKFCAVRN